MLGLLHYSHHYMSMLFVYFIFIYNYIISIYQLYNINLYNIDIYITIFIYIHDCLWCILAYG